MTIFFKFNILAIIMVCSLNSAFVHASEFDDVEMKVTQARGNVYMLQGAGGNIGVLATKDGLIMVDDEFAPLADRINAAMKTISKKGIKYIINTHMHGDHTGSNTYFSKQAPIIAHYNVRERLSDKEPAEQVALPVITFDKNMKIYLADEEITITHLEKGHTDGDSVVYFKNANVLHTGDLFFELGFPYIDLKHGGTVKGYLSDVNYLIKQMPDDAVIIPGHGKLTNKKRYQAFAKMIAYSINHVQTLLDQGKTEQEILAIGIDEPYKKWSWRFINEEKWLKTLISDLSKDSK